MLVTTLVSVLYFGLAVGRMTLGLDICLCFGIGLHLANFWFVDVGLNLGRNVGVSMSRLWARLSCFLGYDKE